MARSPDDCLRQHVVGTIVQKQAEERTWPDAGRTIPNAIDDVDRRIVGLLVPTGDCR